MPDVYCLICSNKSFPIVKKGNYEYLQCNNCETVFTGFIEQDGLVGGEFEIERNVNQNHLRIDRVNEVVKGYKKEEISVLDFGCGHGLFIDDLKKAGYPNVDGYDPYNDHFWRLPEKDKYLVCTMTECVEHLSPPFQELDLIFKSLIPGGAIIIETGFVDVAKEDNVPIVDYLYLNPDAGHSTIFSHHGLDVLMCLKGFVPRLHFDRNVRMYQKPFK